MTKNIKVTMTKRDDSIFSEIKYKLYLDISSIINVNSYNHFFFLPLPAAPLPAGAAFPASALAYSIFLAANFFYKASQFYLANSLSIFKVI